MAPTNIGSFSGILAAFPLDGDGPVFAHGLLGPFHDGLRLLPDIVQDRGVELERCERAGADRDRFTLAASVGLAGVAVALGLDAAQVQRRLLLTGCWLLPSLCCPVCSLSVSCRIRLAWTAVALYGLGTGDRARVVNVEGKRPFPPFPRLGEGALALDQPVSQDEEPGAARKRIGEELKRRRTEAGLLQRELAGRIGYTRECVTMAEGMGELPSETFFRLAGEVVGGAELMLLLRDQAVAERKAKRGRKTPEPTNSFPEKPPQLADALVREGVLRGSVTITGGHAILVELGGRVVMLNRRDLLKNGLTLAGVGLADAPLQFVSSPSVSDGEGARRAVEHVLAPRVGALDVNEWERTAHAYGYEVGTVAPYRLLPNLLAEFGELSDLLDKQPADSAPQRLTGVAGQLAALTAMTFVSLGQPQTARRWWRTARRAADRAGDGPLVAFVRGRQAVMALYGGYSPAQVLTLADEAVAVGSPCTGVVSGLAARAQALAIVGNAEGALEALAELVAMFDHLPEATRTECASQFGWSEQKLRHTESYVHTHLGVTRKAAKAQQQALALYPPANYRGPAQVHLHRAACLIMDGHVSEGVRYATAVVAALPAEYQSDGLVQGSARAALAVVPSEDRALAPVAEYRDLLASTGKAATQAADA